MAIVIQQQPPSLVLSGNQILVEATDLDIVDNTLTQGSSQAAIRLSTGLVDEDYVKFEWNGNTFQVDVVDYVDSDYEVLEQQGESLAVWGAALAQVIQSHPQLMKDYKISHGYVGIYYWFFFNPYTWTSDYNLDITVYAQVSSPVVGDGLYNETVFRKNYAFNIQAYKQITGQYGGIVKHRNQISLPAQLDYAGSVKAKLQYDLSNLLHENKYGHFTFPEADTFFSKRQSGLVEKITVSLWPSYGNPPEDKQGVYLNDFYMFYGKVSEQKERQFNTDGESFLDELSTSKRFLTYAPAEKITDIYAPEKLYFLFRYTGTAKLVCKEYFSDGTTATNTLVTNSVNAYELWEYSAAFMRVRSDSGKVVEKYELWIQDAVDSIVSDIRAFVLDYNFQQYARYFLTKTRLGVYECFRSTGRGVTSEDVRKEFFERQKQISATATTKIREVIEIDSGYEVDINSGYLSEEWNKYWHSELIASGDVYQLKFSEKYACDILQQKNTVAEDDQDLNSFNFTMIMNDVSTEYFNDYDIDPDPPILGDFNYDYNEDYYVQE